MASQINVFYAYTSVLQERFSLNDLLQQLPEVLHADIMRYVFAKDRYVHALGKYLLKQQLAFFGLAPNKLAQLAKDAHNKPQIMGLPLHFNISHSHELVVCGASVDVALGLDVEHIASINVDDFRSCFTLREWQYIGQDRGRFFDLWTRKESVMKADGRGMAIPLEAIDTLEQPIIIQSDSRHWFLRKLDLDAHYGACVCTEVEEAVIDTREIV